MNIVVLDGYVLNPGDISWDPLRALGSLTVYENTAPEDIAERVRGQDVVLVNKVVLGEKELPAMSHVGLVGVLATGYNTIDLKAFASRQIPVCNVIRYGVEDVAQHAMALLLELCRSTTLHSESIKSGEWERSGSWCYWKKTPQSLVGKTLGIIGFGAIGQAVGRLGHAFGMRVCALRRGSHTEIPPYMPFSFVTLQELLAQSDVITLHCPLTSETRHIIDEAAIRQMKPGTIILNTARGPLLDEEACAAALESGQLGGLGADVLTVEPPSADSPLLRAPNTLLTPHIAWATTQARQRLIDLMAGNIRAWQTGHPCNVVNRDLLAEAAQA